MAGARPHFIVPNFMQLYLKAFIRGIATTTLCVTFAFFSAPRAHAELAAILTAGTAGKPKLLKSWTNEQLKALKHSARAEKDPATGTIAHWEGPLLEEFVEKSLDGLPLDQKAQIDLIILKDASGGEALIPRSFVNRYPLLLALKRDHAPLSEIRAVIPWTTQPQSMNEELPVERFFLKNVVAVELGNYRDRYPGAFLVRRTDPSAMKGEKIYVQNCLSCHSAGVGPSQAEISPIAFDAKGAHARQIASGFEHPTVAGFPKMGTRDKRALLNYMDAFRAESVENHATQAKAQ